ncbi:hypothetical protein AAVH_14222 [Aphelenchoides avenae]|nr:hypothetical protein AAVH_14222 [Aphelenchus avenae]
MIVALALLATISQASALELGLGGSISLGGELSADICSPLHRDRCVLVSVKTGGSACIYTYIGGKILEDGLLPRVLTTVETNALLGYKLEMEQYNKKLNALGQSSSLQKPQAPCLCKSCPQQPAGPGSSGSDGDGGSDKEDPHGPNDIPDAKDKSHKEACANRDAQAFDVGIGRSCYEETDIQRPKARSWCDKRPASRQNEKDKEAFSDSYAQALAIRANQWLSSLQDTADEKAFSDGYAQALSICANQWCYQETSFG